MKVERHHLRLLAAAFLFAALSGEGMADNRLVLTSGDASLNLLNLTVEGDSNRLQITQDHFGGGAGNAIALSVTGNLNGGPEGAAFSGAALGPGLAPGHIVQSGSNNLMSVRVEGSSNLFAFAQFGAGHRLDATIVGHGNQASVLQHGMANHAAFSQHGVGNVVSIFQRSW